MISSSLQVYFLLLTVIVIITGVCFMLTTLQFYDTKSTHMYDTSSRTSTEHSTEQSTEQSTEHPTEHLCTYNITDSEADFATLMPWSPQLNCTQPAGGFKAWKSGVVSVLKPNVSRNCSKLFHKDSSEIERVQKANIAWKNELSDDDFSNKTGNCSWVRKELTDNLYNTVLEKNFPLAFVFVISHNPQQVFRLIKLLFRPQNVFCIHYDSKSEMSFKKTFDNIAKCVSNVRIACKQIAVHWGDNTIMDAQMNCFTDLLKLRPFLPAHQQWKYALNLCGTELPLATNYEIVTYLNGLNGSSSVNSGKVKNTDFENLKRLHSNTLPGNLTFHKGYTYNALSLEFVDFLVNDPFAIEIRKFFERVDNSEEHFYSSLFMHPDVPGGFRPELKSRYIGCIMTARWCPRNSNQSTCGCHGKIVHRICICASGDLPTIMFEAERRSNFFHNKYDESLDHTIMDCLEERIVKKNQLEYQKECGN